MIVRIVKMKFKPGKTEEFLLLFRANRARIGSFEGCSKLELLNDCNDPDTFFTYSIWDKEESLENYRNSELFSSVWSKTKILFDAKPEAWSIKPYL
jgi:quinol monooxygenase YgiN